MPYSESLDSSAYKGSEAWKLKQVRERDEQIKRAWAESEEILDLLRNQLLRTDDTPLEIITYWADSLPTKATPLKARTAYNDFLQNLCTQRTLVHTADTDHLEPGNLWFYLKWPALYRLAGWALVEKSERARMADFDAANQFVHIRATAINPLFFASLLGHDHGLGHRVIYYLPESRFYFYDPRYQCFSPTNEEKIRLVIRNWLSKCASEMPATYRPESLTCTLTRDRSLQQVIDCAKSLLSADETFLEGDVLKTATYPKQPEPENINKLQVFVNECLETDPDECLTYKSVVQALSKFCENRFQEPAPHFNFGSDIAPLVERRFNLTRRNDIPGDNGKSHRGWKGLKLRKIS